MKCFSESGVKSSSAVPPDSDAELSLSSAKQRLMIDDKVKVCVESRNSGSNF